MTDTQITSGGPAIPVEKIVSCDQVSIVGDGTSENPLRATGAGGSESAPIVIPPFLAFAQDVSKVEVSGSSLHFTAATSITFGPQMVQGQQISEINVDIFGDGAADLVYSAGIRLASGAFEELSGGVISDAPAAWTTYTLAAFTPRTLAAGEMFFFGYQALAAGIFLGPTFITP